MVMARVKQDELGEKLTGRADKQRRVAMKRVRADGTLPAKDALQRATAIEDAYRSRVNKINKIIANLD